MSPFNSQEHNNTNHSADQLPPYSEKATTNMNTNNSSSDGLENQSIASSNIQSTHGAASGANGAAAYTQFVCLTLKSLYKIIILTY